MTLSSHLKNWAFDGGDAGKPNPHTKAREAALMHKLEVLAEDDVHEGPQAFIDRVIRDAFKDGAKIIEAALNSPNPLAKTESGCKTCEHHA
jgi:hypothetical protein